MSDQSSSTAAVAAGVDGELPFAGNDLSHRAAPALSAFGCRLSVLLRSVSAEPKVIGVDTEALVRAWLGSIPNWHLAMIELPYQGRWGAYLAVDFELSRAAVVPCPVQR